MAGRGSSSELNDRELLFCKAYGQSLNQTRAYMEVYGTGYEAAKTEAGKLMKKPEIRKRIGDLLNLDGPIVLNEIVKIAFAEFTDVASFDGIKVSFKASKDWNDRGRAAVKSIKIGADGSVSIQLHDKLSALDKLAKRLKLYPQEGGTIDALTKLAAEGLLSPGQAEIISEGLQDIEDKVRSLSSGEEIDLTESPED